MLAEIILRPVDVIAYVQEAGDETPHNKRIWEARFGPEPASQIRGFGDTQEAAIANLCQVRDQMRDAL